MNLKKKPQPKETIIPLKFFSKMIKIWDFLMTFKTTLKISVFTLEELYLCLVNSVFIIELLH